MKNLDFRGCLRELYFEKIARKQSYRILNGSFQSNKAIRLKKKSGLMRNRIVMKMKIIFTFFPMFFCLCSGYSQNDYPEPPKTPNRLFYIQHSDNHNTYVYDANIKGGSIDASQPIDEYRMVYTKNGIKKPLTGMQRKFAYGMILLESEPDLFKFRLASRKRFFFYLNYDPSEGARIYVTVNKQKMYLDKMFVQLKNGIFGINVKAKYVLLYGEDYNSGKPVIEKFVVK